MVKKNGKYLTLLKDDFSETIVAEPESPYGFTYADYLTWTFKERIELIRGKIFKMCPAPTVNHQKIQTNILGEFFILLKNKPCKVFASPIDVKLKGKPFRKKKEGMTRLPLLCNLI